MPALKHTHTYVQYKKRPGYFRCADAHCTHFLDKESVIGKASLCNVCGQEFILSAKDLTLVKPRCINCSESNEAKQYRKARALAENLISGLSEE